MSKNNKAVFGLLAICALVIVAWGLRSALHTKRKNVLFIVLDTLRADHLGVYGYERATSPVLDQFAKESIFFKYAVSAAPWTPPSVASMFTGLYPTAHGVMPPNNREKALQLFKRLEEKLSTMAEIMKDHGYQTAGVTPNPWTKPEFGYNQGFDDYTFIDRAIASKINKEAFPLIDKFAGSTKPFFMYLHYIDPHDPYKPPEPYRSAFKEPLKNGGYTEKVMRRINLYDGEIAYLDNQLGELFRYLKEKGIYEDLTIVIVSDHGEQFMEHGNQGHGHQLHNEEVHVVLMVKAGRPPREVEFTVSTVDILPTILQSAEIPIPGGLPGVSLLDDENSRNRAGVFSEIKKSYDQKSFTSFEGEKLIVDYGLKEDDKGNQIPGEKTYGLFDRHKDYAEKSSLKDDALLKRLLQEFEKINQSLSAKEGESTGDVQISDETIKQLKSLGYLH